MQYIKRVLFLFVLLGFAVVGNINNPEISTQISAENIIFLSINILFVLSLIFAYQISKGITRSLGIIIFEAVVLLLLIGLSFLPQMDNLLNHFVRDQFNLDFSKMGLFVYYSQFIFGFWLISFITILRNKNLRRNSLANAVRYMHS